MGAILVICVSFIPYPPTPFPEKGEFKNGVGLDWLCNETVFQNLKHLAKFSWKIDTFPDLRLFWVEDFVPIWSFSSCYSYIEGTH